MLEAAIADAPLTDPVGWLSATRWLPLAYVLVPTCRPTIEQKSSGAMHLRRLAVARAVVAADLASHMRDFLEMRDVSPGLVSHIEELLDTFEGTDWHEELAVPVERDWWCRLWRI